MCNEYSFVQFPGILPTDTAVSINGGNYPISDTVDDLVNNNPQFWYDFGLSGIQTLHTCMLLAGIDLKLSVSRGGDPIPPVTGAPAFVGPRPVVVR